MMDKCLHATTVEHVTRGAGDTELTTDKPDTTHVSLCSPRVVRSLPTHNYSLWGIMIFSGVIK